MRYSLQFENKPESSDVQVLWKGLHYYNTQFSGDEEAQELAIFVRDESQVIVAGVNGWTAFGWLHIDVLWVAENLRGQGWGKKLLVEAEAEGIRRGCKYANLDSFSFQAPEMYKKYGYEEFGVLDNVAGKHKWHFLKKKLV